LFVAGPVPDFSKNTALQVLNLGQNELTGTSNYDSDHSNHEYPGTSPDFSENTALVKLWLNQNKLSGKMDYDHQ
jgi:hypothetical protein